MNPFPKVTVAVVQAAPVLFDRAATVAKACQLTREAAAQGAQLVLFPEAFIPCYPRGLSFGMVVGSRTPAGRQTWQRYWEGAIEVPGEETAVLAAVARETNTYLAMGVIERDSSFSGGTLYCTLLYFGPNGRLLGKLLEIAPGNTGKQIIRQANCLQVGKTGPHLFDIVDLGCSAATLQVIDTE